jgi:hypothetical protein
VIVGGAINFSPGGARIAATPGFVVLDDFSVSTVKRLDRLSGGLGHRTDSLAWTMSAASSSGVALLALKVAP